MSMLDLLRRKEISADPDSRFDKNGSFEHDIEVALDLDMEEQINARESGGNLTITDRTLDPSAPSMDVEPEPIGEVLTPHAQSLLATFSVFEKANSATRDELAVIGKAFTSIVTNYNLGRDFIESCRQEIVRASELEQANQKLTVENRRLGERIEKQDGARERLDDILETAKRRETRLIQDSDTLRLNLSDLRLELIEARNANVAAEHARAEMHMALASKTADAERMTREIEVLREKLSGATVELDSSQKRQAEMRMRLEELQSLYVSETARYTELSSKAASADKEILRLQKQCDAGEAQIKETALALQNAEHDIWERDRRHQSELQSLKAETEQLASRLQWFAETDAATPEPATEEAAMPVIPLRARLSDQPRRLHSDLPATAAE